MAKYLDIKWVVIRSHSAYLVNCLSNHIWEWEENDYLRAAPKYVVHRLQMDKIHDMIEESIRERRCTTQFWQVPKDSNSDARAHARSASDYGHCECHMCGEATHEESRAKLSSESVFYWHFRTPEDEKAQAVCRRFKIPHIYFYRDRPRVSLALRLH